MENILNKDQNTMVKGQGSISKAQSIKIENQAKTNSDQNAGIQKEKKEYSEIDGRVAGDFEEEWYRWKCLVCKYLYEGKQIELVCPKCGNNDPDKFIDVD